jgi:hypothetical protein
VVFVQAGRHEVLYFGWQIDDHTVESVTATDKNGILASHTPAAEEPAGMTP